MAVREQLNGLDPYFSKGINPQQKRWVDRFAPRQSMWWEQQAINFITNYQQRGAEIDAALYTADPVRQYHTVELVHTFGHDEALAALIFAKLITTNAEVKHDPEFMHRRNRFFGLDSAFMNGVYKAPMLCDVLSQVLGKRDGIIHSIPGQKNGLEVGAFIQKLLHMAHEDKSQSGREHFERLMNTYRQEFANIGITWSGKDGVVLDPSVYAVATG